MVMQQKSHCEASLHHNVHMGAPSSWFLQNHLGMYSESEHNETRTDMDATGVKFAFGLSHSIGNKDQMHLNKKKKMKWESNPLTLCNHFFLHLKDVGEKAVNE